MKNKQKGYDRNKDFQILKDKIEDLDQKWKTTNTKAVNIMIRLKALEGLLIEKSVLSEGELDMESEALQRGFEIHQFLMGEVHRTGKRISLEKALDLILEYLKVTGTKWEHINTKLFDPQVAISEDFEVPISEALKIREKELRNINNDPPSDIQQSIS